MSANFISFPAGRLGESSLRIAVLLNREDFFALDKPPGLAIGRDAWRPKTPDLLGELQHDLGEGKPQLERLGIGQARQVHHLDSEASGVVLLAKSAEAERALRNTVGSRQMRLTYLFLAEGRAEEQQWTCDLPIAPHASESRMLVSHTTGKKTETRFFFERRYGDYNLWRAETSFDRQDQIRVHAREAGLTIVGEKRYGRSHPVMLSSIKRDYRARGEERPLYDALCLHLHRIDVPRRPDISWTVESGLPKNFRVLLTRLERHAR